MRVPLGWLRDYVDLSATTDEIVERLAMLGFPVESVERRPQLSGVVAGRIVALEPHPNADRLQVSHVDVGAAQPLVIATAATNVAVGQTVPVATIGAQLVRDGKPLLIELRPMRGLESQGMLCSADELGFEPALFEDGILQLDDSVVPGTDVVEHFRLLDPVLEIEITANRVDVMSMVGVARELGAAFSAGVRDPIERLHLPTAAPQDASSGDLRVSIESPDCRRFVAERFSNVRVRMAPAWIRFRLALAGQRPINNVVDILNFVMLELGQPQHAYDFARLAGARLVARDAHDREVIRTLDGEDRTLTPQALVIADAERAQCIAGLRGAADSEVGDTTSEIVVESATFAGPRIRRLGLALGLRTDASSRHERGLAPELADVAAARAAGLLVNEGATAHPALAVGIEPTPRAPIVVSPQRVCALIGIDVAPPEMARSLRSLGFEVGFETASAQFGDPDSDLVVTPPYWRNDVTIFADVAEEVARIAGYDRIVAASPPVYEQAISSSEYLHERHIAHCFADGGYREVATLSLQPHSVYERFVTSGIVLGGEPVEIFNPLSEDQRYLRFSLVPALLSLAQKFASMAPLRLFEVGHVFERTESDPFEFSTTAWMYVAQPVDEPGWRDSPFLTFKGEALAIVRAICGRDADTVTTESSGLHPGKSASLVVDGKDVATIGAADPRLLAAYGIDRPVYIGSLRTHDIPGYTVPMYRAPSKYPAVERDIALIVAGEIPVHEIEHAIVVATDGVVKGVRAFDDYRGPQIGEGSKSIAVRVKFQRDDATLTDAEVDGHMSIIVKSLRERVGARIRE